MTARSRLFHLFATTALGTSLLCGSAAAQTPADQSPSDTTDRSIAQPSANQPSTAQTPPAQPTTPAPVPTPLDAVTTAATRQSRPIDAIAGTVSVITREQMDRENVQNINELVRNEPGVSVGNQAGRGAYTNFVIRGIGGNRVLVMVDGLRMPDFAITNSGSPTGYTRDFMDLENVKRVEIIRGPASALYGSDALGGVIAYITKDPSDYLIGDRQEYVSLKGAYDGSNQMFAETLTGAAKRGMFEMLALYTHRNGQQTSINSPGFYPNPISWKEDNFLGKFVVKPTEVDTFRITGEYVQKTSNIWNLNGIGSSTGLQAKIFDEWSTDVNQRWRISGQWVHDAPVGFVDRSDFTAYFTAINRQENTSTLRGVLNTGMIPTISRIADYWFIQNLAGAEWQLNTKRELGETSHDMTYGLSFAYTWTTRPRMRLQGTLGTTTVTATNGLETFPNKNFPDTQTAQAGVYLQDEIKWGRLTATPGIRLDYYSLMPNPDAAFWRSNGSISLAPNASTYFSASPKLGLLYQFTEEYQGYFQYARGFRAPPYDNANFAWTNSAGFYQVIPNNNLKPETADSFELGARGKYRDGSSWQLSSFYNMYNNFIDTVTLRTAAPPAFTIFQYQNLSNVTIWGIEARGEYRFLPDWAVGGWFAYAQGNDQLTAQPIDSVDPWKLQGRVRYGSGTGFGAQLIGTLVGAHNAVNQQTITGAFQTPGYFNLDALASYDFNKAFTINAGVYNVTNAQYWNSQDVIGLAAGNPQINRSTQPGTYFGVNLTARW